LFIHNTKMLSGTCYVLTFEAPDRGTLVESGHPYHYERVIRSLWELSVDFKKGKIISAARLVEFDRPEKFYDEEPSYLTASEYDASYTDEISSNQVPTLSYDLTYSIGEFVDFSQRKVNGSAFTATVCYPSFSDKNNNMIKYNILDKDINYGFTDQEIDTLRGFIKDASIEYDENDLTYYKINGNKTSFDPWQSGSLSVYYSIDGLSIGTWAKYYKYTYNQIKSNPYPPYSYNTISLSEYPLDITVSLKKSKSAGVNTLIIVRTIVNEIEWYPVIFDSIEI